MPVVPAYQDFFEFLEKKEEYTDSWELFLKIYVEPHKKFLLNLWKEQGWLNIENLKRRVVKLKKEDYALLMLLTKYYDVQEEAEKVLKRCVEISKEVEPQFYIFVDQGSPDGVVVETERRHYIPGVNIDRWRDFFYLDVMVAHTFAHWLQKKAGMGKKTLKDLLLLEGEAVIFSKKVIPEAPIHKIVFLPEESYRKLKSQEIKVALEIAPHLNKPIEEAARELSGKIEVMPWKYYMGYLAYTKPHLFGGLKQL